MHEGLAPASRGILGLYLKDPSAETELGTRFGGMIERQQGKYPHGSAVAVYGRETGEGCLKVSLRHPDPAYDWERLAARLGRFRGCTPELQVRGTHAVIAVRAVESAVRNYLRAQVPDVTFLGAGARVEIIEQAGELPAGGPWQEIAGSHALGHTGAGPALLATADGELFAAGRDVCVVHDGALERPQRLRARLQREGFELSGRSDAALAAAFLTSQLQQGATLALAVDRGLSEFAGFAAFTAATRDTLVLALRTHDGERLVVAEHEDFAAFAASGAALHGLPGIADAHRSPAKPGTFHAWTREVDAREIEPEFVVLG